MRIGWLWVPVVAMIVGAFYEGVWVMLGAIAIVIGSIVVAMAAEDKIGARVRRSKSDRRPR